MNEATSIGTAIDIARPQFEKITAKMPLVHRLNYEAEQRFAIQHLQNNAYLMEVARNNPASLQAAMCNLAGVGLSLNPALKFAYLIPRNMKVGKDPASGRDVWETRICAEPGYMGLSQLATDTGSIKWCQARLVYTNDDYRPAKPGQLPEHDYDPFSEERGEIRGVYCVAKTVDGDYLTDELSIQRVNDIRDRTEIFKKAVKDDKAPYGPWVTDYPEQVLKTCVRHAYKLWPKTAQSELMAQAVQLSNDNEGFEPIISNPTISQYTADQKQFLDQLMEKSDALGMLTFSKSIEEGVFTSLYHSFERGSKGKYQRLIDDLLAGGIDQTKDYANRIVEATDNNDESAIAELKEELSEEELELVLKDLPEPVIAFVNDVEISDDN